MELGHASIEVQPHILHLTRELPKPLRVCRRVHVHLHVQNWSRLHSRRCERACASSTPIPVELPSFAVGVVELRIESVRLPIRSGGVEVGAVIDQGKSSEEGKKRMNTLSRVCTWVASCAGQKISQNPIHPGRAFDVLNCPDHTLES